MDLNISCVLGFGFVDLQSDQLQALIGAIQATGVVGGVCCDDSCKPQCVQWATAHPHPQLCPPTRPRKVSLLCVVFQEYGNSPRLHGAGVGAGGG
jgi:hypothetical protein